MIGRKLSRKPVEGVMRCLMIVTLALLGLAQIGCGSDSPEVKEPEGDHSTPTEEIAFVVITAVNGQPASGNTFESGDELSFEGAFSLRNGESQPKWLKSSIVKQGDVIQSTGTLTKPVLTDSGNYTFRSTIKVGAEKGEQWLRCHYDSTEFARLKIVVK